MHGFLILCSKVLSNGLSLLRNVEERGREREGERKEGERDIKLLEKYSFVRIKLYMMRKI